MSMTLEATLSVLAHVWFFAFCLNHAMHLHMSISFLLQLQCLGVNTVQKGMQTL